MKTPSKQATKFRFFTCESGETSIQIATFFSALAVLVALVSTPLLNEASRTYAENQRFGVDRTVTGSVEKNKRYTVRRSILDNTGKKQ